MIGTALVGYLLGSFVMWWCCRHNGAKFHDVDRSVDLLDLLFGVTVAWAIIPGGYIVSAIVAAKNWVKANS